MNRLAIVSAAAALLTAGPAMPAPLCNLDDVELRGTFSDLESRAELSGAAMRGDYLILESNEAIGPARDYHAVQVFAPDGPNAFRWIRDEVVYRAKSKDCKQADFEGLALQGNRLYVVASHSSAHKKLKEKDSYEKNRKRLVDFEVDDCPGRHSLRQFTMDSDARIQGNGKKLDLARIIGKSKLLKAFAALPSKENGVDIEGLAVRGDDLYIGFRAPVLRNNFVPVLRMKDAAPKDNSLMFLDLGGRGIRDMAALPDGFLLIGGPSGDQNMSFGIYYWDGADMVPGKNRPSGGTVKMICEMPYEKDGNPEGIAVTSRTAGAAQVIIVYDSNIRLIARRATLNLD